MRRLRTGHRRSDVQRLRDVCDLFNAASPPGTLVDYWRGTRDPGEPPSGTGAVRAPGAYVLGEHTAVVHIDGCSGCIALTHVRPTHLRPTAVPPAASEGHLP